MDQKEQIHEMESWKPSEDFTVRAMQILYVDKEGRPNHNCRIGKAWWSSPEKRNLDILLSSILTPACCFVIFPFAMRKQGLIALSRIHPGYPYVGAVSTKLRTMIINAESLEAKLTKNGQVYLATLKRSGDDPRITPFGKYLRKLSIDELPQIMDVLMYPSISWVGPRPFSENEWKSLLVRGFFEPYNSFFRYMEKGLKYGLTGMYGIFGRADLELPERIYLETLYAKYASLPADLNILLHTPLAVLSRKGAY
jgi:lipopolysaccharide/colanic/teichoic acid biosynthesis glycosyltransferase